MATVREYFDVDFSRIARVVQNHAYTNRDGSVILVEAKICLDYDTNSKYIACYIPGTTDRTEDVITFLVNDLTILSTQINDLFEVSVAYGEGLSQSSNELIFTGRMFFYCERPITESTTSLRKKFKDKGILLEVRGPEYARSMSETIKPLAFISHDSRDKDCAARPIAQKLSELMCPVWFDEYSLKVGDNLRQSIEKGIKECRKCIIILSPSFLSNEGWTRAEFDSVFTREMIEKSNIILPVWYGVTKEEVYQYSPSIANKFGLVLKDDNFDEVVIKLRHAIL